MKTLATLVIWDFENIKNRDPNKQIDILKQKQLIEYRRGTNVTHVAFIGDFSKNARSGFQKNLEEYGFKVHTKKPKRGVSKNGDTFLEVDMDAEIVHFMMEESSFFSTIILVSGDADMYPTLNTLLKRGKSIEIYALKGRLSKKLNVFKTEYLSGFKDA